MGTLRLVLALSILLAQGALSGESLICLQRHHDHQHFGSAAPVRAVRAPATPATPPAPCMSLKVCAWPAPAKPELAAGLSMPPAQKRLIVGTPTTHPGEWLTPPVPPPNA